jgi:hypothetical protein
MVLSITKKNHSPIYFGRSSFLIELEIESKLDLGLILDGYGFAVLDPLDAAHPPNSCLLEVFGADPNKRWTLDKHLGPRPATDGR